MALLWTITSAAPGFARTADLQKAAPSKSQIDPTAAQESCAVEFDEDKKFFDGLRGVKGSISAETLSEKCAGDASCQASCKESWAQGFREGTLSLTVIERIPPRAGITSACQNAKNPGCCHEGHSAGALAFNRRLKEELPPNCMADYSEGIRRGELDCKSSDGHCEVYQPKVCYSSCFAAGHDQGMAKCRLSLAATFLSAAHGKGMVGGAVRLGMQITDYLKKPSQVQQTEICEDDLRKARAGF
jgi:hypothetical protein